MNRFLGTVSMPANDSAYWFHSLQMCHDFCVVLVQNTAYMASRQKCSKVWLYFTWKDDNMVTCNTCKVSISSKGGTTSSMQKHLGTQQFICKTVARLIHYYLATQVSQASVDLTGHHLLLMLKVPLNSTGRPGFVYLVNVSTISLSIKFRWWLPESGWLRGCSK